MVTALEHCDMVAAVLCGITDARQAPRSVCAMGHKWMWNRELGGLPAEEFLIEVDPLLAGVRAKLEGRYATSDQIAGQLSAEWAAKLGLRAGIPIPVGAFDAHWDAIGAGVREGDVVNVVGTSTCIMAIARASGLDPRRLRRGEGVHPSAVLRASRRACRLLAISSTPSRGARAPPWRSFRRAWSNIAAGRPACCGSLGITATAPCW